MAPVKVVPHPPAIAAMLRSEDIRATIEPAVFAVLTAARASAPVLTGAYKDGLGVESDTADTVVERVGSSVRYAPFVEADTGNLLRALDAAGGF